MGQMVTDRVTSSTPIGLPGRIARGRARERDGQTSGPRGIFLDVLDLVALPGEALHAFRVEVRARELVEDGEGHVVRVRVLVGALLVRASKTSATATIRASSGMASPARP